MGASVDQVGNTQTETSPHCFQEARSDFPSHLPWLPYWQKKWDGVNLEILSIHPKATELTPERPYSTGGGQTRI